MYLKKLYLHNFRLYKEVQFEFSPHVNVIYGENGTGKTSLLEAISLLGIGRSFRTHHTSHLIKHELSHFYLEAEFIKYGISQHLRICYSNTEKKVWINNTLQGSASSLCGTLLNVVLSPLDIELIGGSPQGRRHFLDVHLSQTNPLYMHHLARYTRAMKQRNQLLKNKQLLSIESWEHEMATSAAFIVQQRILLVSKLEAHASVLYGRISNREHPISFSLKSCSKKPIAADELFSFYLEQYHKNRYKEMLQATTLYGPHRDDLQLHISGEEARSFASEGEKRSLVSALRLAEWYVLRDGGGVNPLMLIDEVSATLDSNRCTQLLSEVENLSQVFLTATSLEPFKGVTKEMREIKCC